MTDRLEVFAEDWTRGLAVVAHPDDMEYGAASAVARWSTQGKDIRYVLVIGGRRGSRRCRPRRSVRCDEPNRWRVAQPWE